MSDNVNQEKYYTLGERIANLEKQVEYLMKQVQRHVPHRQGLPKFYWGDRSKF